MFDAVIVAGAAAGLLATPACSPASLALTVRLSLYYTASPTWPNPAALQARTGPPSLAQAPPLWPSWTAGRRGRRWGHARVCVFVCGAVGVSGQAGLVGAVMGEILDRHPRHHLMSHATPLPPHYHRHHLPLSLYLPSPNQTRVAPPAPPIAQPSTPTLKHTPCMHHAHLSIPCPPCCITQCITPPSDHCLLHTASPPTPPPTHLHLPPQVKEAMCAAFKSAGGLAVNSAVVVRLDPVGAKFV